MHLQDTTIPLGLCHCGCGKRTKIAATSRTAYGWVAGQPRLFLRGHYHPTPSLLRVCAACGKPFVVPSSREHNGRTVKYCSPPCHYRDARIEPTVRFWAKVHQNGAVPARCPELGACWPWAGALGRQGYGRFQLDGRLAMASHVAWMWAADAPPIGTAFVCHTCDNPACVRNDTAGVYALNGVLLPRRGHLFLGTTQDNMADKVQKGRHIGPWSRALAAHPEYIRRGEAVGTAKSTVAQVRTLRERHSRGETISSLARWSGLARRTVREIVHYRTWRHVS